MHLWPIVNLDKNLLRVHSGSSADQYKSFLAQITPDFRLLSKAFIEQKVLLVAFVLYFDIHSPFNLKSSQVRKFAPTSGYYKISHILQPVGSLP